MLPRAFKDQRTLPVEIKGLKARWTQHKLKMVSS
jgi:hypothetical protein